MDFKRSNSAADAATALLGYSAERDMRVDATGRILSSSSSIETVQLQLKARRKAFAFIVVLDFLLSLILWLLIGASEHLLTSLKSVSVLVNYQKSLFDLVIASFIRVLVLILWYWILALMSRLAVTFTAVASMALLIVKCFYYKFGQSHEDYLEYFFIFSTAVLIWTEFGFYEIRVLPAYRKIQIVKQMEAIHRRAGSDSQSRSYQSIGILGSRSDAHTPYLTPDDTPPGTPTSTRISQSDSTVSLEHPSSDDSFLTAEQRQEYIEIGRQSIQICMEMANDTMRPWKTEKLADAGRVICESLERPKPQTKLFRCRGVVPCSSVEIFRILYLECEKTPQWNSSVAKCEVLYRIDNRTDIIYNIAAEAAGGMVSRRDFVNVRYWEKQGDIYISGGKGIEYSRMPKQDGIIRGLNGPGGYIMAPSSHNHQHSLVTWVLDTDLKGWIPQYIIDKALAGVMLNFFSSLTERVERLRREGGLHS